VTLRRQANRPAEVVHRLVISRVVFITKGPYWAIGSLQRPAGDQDRARAFGAGLQHHAVAAGVLARMAMRWRRTAVRCPRSDRRGRRRQRRCGRRAAAARSVAPGFEVQVQVQRLGGSR
jgi:hypothetical protein